MEWFFGDAVWPPLQIILSVTTSRCVFLESCPVLRFHRILSGQKTSPKTGYYFLYFSQQMILCEKLISCHVEPIVHPYEHGAAQMNISSIVAFLECWHPGRDYWR
jgi:hypothetical protein